jgi:hypothetical protein
MNTSKKPYDLRPFIPSQLDDYRLPPALFRLVGRIARRVVCTESVPNMARGCRLNPKTVKAALPQLVALGIVSKEKRRGKTSVYGLAPMTGWAPSPWASRGQTAAQAPKRAASKPESVPDHPGRFDTRKGNVSEGHPRKGGGAKLFPHEVTRWITAIRAQVKLTPASDTTTLDGLYGKLESLEVEYFGCVVTRRPRPVAAQPPAVPASGTPAEPRREITDEDIKRLKAAVQ